MSQTETNPRTARPAVPVVTGSVVVGYDGSWQSLPALYRAAAEATERGLPLMILSIVPTSEETQSEPLTVSATATSAAQEWQRASEDAEAAAEELRRGMPDLRVVLEVLLDSDRDRLASDLSASRLLVLGTRGRRQVRAFLLGTASRLLLHGVHCPVLVVPAETPTDEAVHDPDGGPRQVGAVLLGLGEGAEAPRTLRVAAEEAVRRGCPLHVLRSYAEVSPQARPHRARVAWDAVHEQLAQGHLDPTLRVTVILTPDPPADAMLQHGRLAELVVVGSRGPLALARLANDSVSRAVLDAATWPVLLVPR